MLRHVAACCSVLQCVAVCCSMLQLVAVCYSASQCAAVCCSVSQCIAVRCSVLQCVAVCCSVCKYINSYASTVDIYKHIYQPNCCSESEFVTFHSRRKLQYTATHCNTQCTTVQQPATTCNTLQYTATHCNTRKFDVKDTRVVECCERILHHTATHRNALHNGNACLIGRITLQHIAEDCDTLQHSVTHCNTLQTHCNTLQHTATHCNTLQHTATHCNTPSP